MFSPDGKKILVSYSSSDNRSLFSVIFDTEKEFDPSKEQTASESLTNLPFTALTNKCVWATNSESLYCAYANPLPEGDYLWPFDYWQGKVATHDSFAKFSWKTGEFKIYAENTAYDADNLALARNESFLIFINRQDLGLYRLKL